MADVLNYTEEKKRCLARTGAIAYTIGNYLPHECKWELREKDIIEIIGRLTEPFLGNEVKDITLGAYPLQSRDSEGRKTTKNIAIAYVWLSKDSRHLIDKSLNEMDTAIRMTVDSPSDKIKEYAAKFSVDGKLHKVNGQNTGMEDRRKSRSGPTYTGIVVDVFKFLMLEFDPYCNNYGENFGKEFKRNCNLFVEESEYRELSPGDYTLVRMIISKSEKRMTAKQLRPKKSLNAF